MNLPMLRVAISVFACALLALNSSAADPQINFSRDIRAMLSDNCFTCHGPDPGQRKAKLRLDTKEGAFEIHEGHPIIKPGDSAESELYKRITATDPDDVMPPPKTGKKLSSAQIELFKKWIDQGAKWEMHWAFQKPVRPEVPQVKNKSWPRNEVDNFIDARLEKQNLTPNPVADKPTLIRRASLDVTGIPPTPEEVDAFLADGSEGAYEKVVDRLLESSRYGEQMARYWLDGARYADSHGYHIDSMRSIWKYREWVINAYNQNMPFDEFTKEQLAGDLIPDATPSQKIASGFIRCNMSTGEGGAIEEEYRAKYGFDRLETTSTLWLGLTMTCCRCHTHKYDPLTQKEYYQLFAFFNSLDVPIMDNNLPHPDPFMKIPSARQAERQAWLKDSIAEADKKIAAPIPELDEQQPEWQRKWHETLSRGWEPLSLTVAASNHPAVFKSLDDKSVTVESSGEAVWDISAKLGSGTLGGIRLETLPDDKADAFRVSEIEAELVTGSESPRKLKFQLAASDTFAEKNGVASAIDGKADTFWSAPKTEKDPHLAVFLLKEPQTFSESSTLKLRLRLKDGASEKALAHFRLSAATDHSLIATFFGTKSENWRMIGPFKGEDAKVALRAEYPPEKSVDFSKSYPGVREDIRWNEQGGYTDGKSHVVVDNLHGVHGVYYFSRTIHAAAPAKLEASLRADDYVRVWLNGELLTELDHKLEVGAPPIRLTLNLKEGENRLLVKVVNHQGECRFAFDQKLLDDQSLPSDLAALLAATATPSGQDATRVRNHFRLLRSPEWKHTSENLALWREEQQQLDAAIPTTLIAKESSKPRETHMLMRGEYDKLGDVVTPGVPAILPPLPANAPRNRLALAEWLVSPEHPLTARVMVNRLWQQYFGIGLVKTTEDFGMQGEPPSHPELLDWLATEFMQSGWDVKHIQKLILMSATYRQSSAAPPALFARDPENRLLARGPRFRLDGETLRDTALAVSGLLVEEIGGPSVKPYQPGGLWEAVSYNNAQKYEQDKGEANYRRTLYTHWKRQSPPPNLLIFDSPTREYCVVRRPRTNTPLQALVLLNDPQFVEASRAFASRIVHCGSNDDRKRLEWAFKLATSRKPSAEEVQVLEDTLHAELADFEKNSSAATKLAKAGDASPELAAWTTVASMILNLDETVTKN
jgi:hypothetical protein